MALIHSFVSIDAGTTSLKVALFDSTGRSLALTAQEYQLETPDTDIVEFSAEQYWSLLISGVRSALAKAGVDPRGVLSVAISSQAETLIVVDRDGKPLRKAIVWLDNRSRREAEELKEAFGILGGTGQTDVTPTWPITKILWLRRHEPDLFAQAHKFLLLEDFLLFRLCGEYVGEYSLYSSSYMVDIAAKRWITAVLDYAGIRRDQLVTLVEPGAAIGRLLPRAAAEMGLAHGAVVVSGAMDQAASLVGSGNIGEGVVTETTGSALSICRTLTHFVGGSGSTSPIHYHAIPDRYYSIDWCPTGGMSLRWLRDLLTSRAGSSAIDYDELAAFAERIPPGSQGLLFFPFLSGMGSFGPASSRHGIFYDVELHHGRGHFARAVMEAVAYLIRYSIEQGHHVRQSERGRADEIRSLGGGAAGHLWLSIKANATGRVVVTLESRESSLLGIAILQAVSCGDYTTFEEAVEAMVAVRSRVVPDPAVSRRYEQLYLAYTETLRSIYPASAGPTHAPV